MSAYNDLLNRYEPRPATAAAHFRELLDAHRTEVRTEALQKAIGRLRAIPVTCTALTGPVWYGNGWNAAITCLEEIADYQKPDNEAYPGELQRLRAVVRELRAAALRQEDLPRVRQLLVDHASYEAAACEQAKTGGAR